MTVYISGGITGVPNHEENFAARAKALSDAGYLVVNPVTKGKALARRLGREPTWEEYMKESLCHLMRCDGISMLPGHTNSKGASIELDLARKLGMTEVHIMPVKRRG